MLPNFLIIGAQKAATSWLATCLGEHPDVFIVGEKEIHFFNHYFDRGLAWYESHFESWSGQAAIGEATPGYINYPATPGRIQATLGNRVKFIASLRNPVDRAHSAFWHYVCRGDIPAEIDFLTAFRRGDQFGLDRFGLYDRGDYFEHLRRYFEYFPRENFLTLIYEEVLQDSQAAISNCLEFLDLDPNFVPAALSDRVNKGRDLRLFHSHALALRETVVSRTALLPESIRSPLKGIGRRAFAEIFRRLPKKNSYTPLPDDVRQELLNDFMPGIKQLEQLLDRDLSIWYAS